MHNFPSSFSFLCRRNIPRSASHEYLTECLFDPHTEKGRTCPIFTLKQIVDMYNNDEGFYDDLATKVRINIYAFNEDKYIFTY